MQQQCIIILPAYNEEDSLGELLDEFVAIQQRLGSYQIILINDGSVDRTVQVAQQFQAKLNLRIVNHEVNKGLGPAIKTGLYQALHQATSGDDVVVYMDADSTHSPAYILSMKQRILEGADLVIASRFLAGSREIGVPFMRRLYSRGARILFKLFLPLPGVTDFTCGYRAYRLNLIKNALECYGDGIIERTGFACTDELLVNLATFDIKIAEVPFVLRYDKKKGKSKLQLGLTILETIRMLLKARKKLLAPKIALPEE